MKITDIKTYLVNAGWRNWLFVQVYTDVGLVGLGESTMSARSRSIAAAVEEMSPYLMGHDPTHIERICQKLYHGFHWRGGPVLTSAISGIETALWDITGQALNVPIYCLLGGPCREDFRCYANGWFKDARTPEQFARCAADAVARSFTALKWNPFRGMRGWLSRQQMRLIIEQVEAVRNAVGDDVDLLIECHGLLNPHSAIEAARRLQHLGIFWMEEPVPPENVRALARVRRQVPIPIAAGERFYTIHGFVELLEQQAVDVIQPDVLHAGGILETRKIAAMAEAHYVDVAPHNSNSPVATASALHINACLRNFVIQELPIDDVPWREEILTEPIETVTDGQLHLISRPGLGVKLNEQVALAHPYEPPTI